MKKNNIRKILVPIDFSKMSIQAIETAKSLAQRFEASIHLAHVRQFDYPIGFMAPPPPFAPFSMATYDQKEEKRTARQLNDLANKYGLSSETCHLLLGAPAFDEICRLAQEISVDLIVTSTHGHTGLKHAFLGSTAERVVQHSPCPVFVGRQTRRQSKESALSFNTILVPVDFSGCSLEGLTYAISIANKFAAKIILLHAVYLGYAYTSDGYAMYDLSTVTDTLRKDAERQMRVFVKAAKFGGVKFKTVITIGSPVAEICAFAHDHNVDLIITSTHGRTGFKHVLIGSTAEQVVRRADRSVLVVPSHPEIRSAPLTRRTQRTRKPTRKIVGRRASKRQSIESEQFTKKYRKRVVHAFPERRQTNKFRESHSS
jgi:nucleotide-binding universal stress UspA family protein